jgi:hypothetical protein
MPNAIMRNQNPTSQQVNGWLETLGLDSLCQWDTLWFVHRHHASLVSAEHIAGLLGYPTGEVVAALEVLEHLGLAQRSRVSQAARLYELATPADPQRGDALDRLTGVAGSRAGRLLLAKALRRGAPSDRGRPSGLNPMTAQMKHHPARRREGATWKKAI